MDDVAYSTYDFQPGMTTVAEMPFGQYIMTYEFWGAPEAAFAVYYRISTDPTNFNASVGKSLIAADGTIPTSLPYIVWSSTGGLLDTLAVRSGRGSQVYPTHPRCSEKVRYTRKHILYPQPSGDAQRKRYLNCRWRGFGRHQQFSHRRYD